MNRPADFDRAVVAELERIRYFALRLTRQRDTADDLVSDTVLRAFVKWEQFEPGSSMGAWLTTIMYRRFLTLLRSGDGRTARFSELSDRFDTESPVDLHDEVFGRTVDAGILRAIHQLPDAYRVAVVLSDVCDWSYGEIARTLALPQGTVKSRIFRGRRILQEQLVRWAA